MGAQNHPAEGLNRVANQISSPGSRARSGRFGGSNSAPLRPIWQPLMALALLTVFLLCSGPASASVTASISGTVKDQTGAAIVGATVTATNTDTNIAETQPTNSQGFYSFQALLLGPYRIDIQQTGFKAFRQTDLVLDVNAALVVDATLQVGQVTETVTVASTALHVETANTQMGEVIGGHEMTTVPLVTRSYTDLLALQPGVVSTSSGIGGQAAGEFTSAGFAMPAVSGDLNAGNQSVNGMREASNGFLLNGGTVQEGGYGGAAVIPNLDSIAEFRILTNNFDAEYGNFSGGQINVITKSGTNLFHGNLFEFVRNTAFDARNFFDPERGAYHQNQFGGTIGGPIQHDKIFFFADYQGNRKVRGISSGLIFVPSDAEKMGNFSALALPANPFAGHTVGGAFNQVLTTQLGYPVMANEPYYFAGCTTNNPVTGCVFPNAQIPVAGFSAPAANLLQFIPSPGPNGAFSASSFSERLVDNKTSGRVDANTRFGLLSGYYYYDNYSLNSPYWPAPANLVPGFNVLGTGRNQLVNLGDTKTIGASSVNEFRLQYVRVAVIFNQPAGGTGKTLSSLGFVTGTPGQNTPGIVPLAPQIQGVPEIDFVNFVIGVPSRPNKIFENTFQVIDNFSRVLGTHTVKIGGSFHYNQLTENLINVANGNFQFNGASETGIDFADFLIGAPSIYVQGQSYPSYGRNRYMGLYGQDSWRARPNVTINYGLRWEFSTPWWEKFNEIQTLVPGLQSVVFPGAPTGWVFPGDPGIPRTLAPTRYNNFGPRLGVAWSPSPEGGLLGKILGASGQTSIRAGYGLIYSSFEGATNFNEIGDAPFGNFVGITTSLFDRPFFNRVTGVFPGQPFPAPTPPRDFSPQHPATGLAYTTLAGWLNAFGTIGGSPGFFNKNRLPYAEHYELSIQRQFFTSTLLTVSYVGTQAHRLLSTLESNPGNPELCLSLNLPSQVMPGTPTCGPGGESNVYTTAAGQTVNGTRAPFGINFGSNGYFTTIGNSNYNSFQVNLRHGTKRAQVLVGYTWSKSIDNGSGYGEQIDPVNQRKTRGLSAFDVTHNFVGSYNYRLPIDKLPGPKRLTDGWALSGITTFSTGLPVTLIELDDRSLLGTSFTGPIPLPVDTPNFAGGSLHFTDPRSGQPYFDTSLFSSSALGQQGTANRRFFHGPGINNWNMALLKDTHFGERLDLQFRAEFFNLFNHAQFGQPNGLFPNPTSFGRITSARDPRIGQLSLKLNF